VKVKVLVDAQGKVSLTRVRARTYDLYEAEELSDGSILLRPLIALPEADLTARTHPAAQAASTREAQVSTVISGAQQIF
jgi:hypothetical protein